MEYLYTDFLQNDDSYSASERLWSDLVRDVEHALGQDGHWVEWTQKTYADGTTPLDHEGSPIAEGFSRAMGRAFQIIQQAPDDSKRALVGGYITRRDDPIYEGTGFPPLELTIVVVLTDRAISEVRRILEVWMNPSNPIEATERAIEELSATGL